MSNSHEKMQTWCIYIDEAGSPYDKNQFQVIYAAICVPFNSQQNFLESYLRIVDSLIGISGGEIKYGPLLSRPDIMYQEETERVCSELLTRFFEIEGARIIRVKAIKKLMRKTNDDLRAALFRKTLELCKNSLPQDNCAMHRAMILHDELDNRDRQRVLLNTFNRFNKDLSFQNCIFVHSNENPFIQFADFIASIYYRYYYFDKHKYKNKEKSKSLVTSLFEKIETHFPFSPIVELSEHQVIEGNQRRSQALQLASEHDIPPEIAYQIVDENITLDEVLQRKQTRAVRRRRAARRQNEDTITTLGELLKENLLKNRDES